MMGAKDKRVDSGHLNVRLLRAKKDIESLIGQLIEGSTMKHLKTFEK